MAMQFKMNGAAPVWTSGAPVRNTKRTPDGEAYASFLSGGKGNISAGGIGSASGTVSSFSGAAGGQKTSGYSPYADAQSIHSYKRNYMNAFDAGDLESANRFQELAKTNYQNLRQNGYGDLADRLQASDVSNSAKSLGELQFDNYRTQYTDAQNKKIDGALQNALAELTAQKENVNRDYSNQARKAYIQYLQNQKNLPQQLKASGITGGLSESSQIALSNNYGEQASENERARLSALQDLDRDALRVRTDAEGQKADLQSELASQYYQYLLNQNNQDFQADENRKNRDAQWSLQKDAQNWQTGENAKSLEQNQTQFEQNQKYNYDVLKNGDEQLDKKLAYDKEVSDRDYKAERGDAEFDQAVSLAQMGYPDLLAKILGVNPSVISDRFLNWIRS